MSLFSPSPSKIKIVRAPVVVDLSDTITNFSFRSARGVSSPGSMLSPDSHLDYSHLNGSGNAADGSALFQDLRRRNAEKENEHLESQLLVLTSQNAELAHKVKLLEAENAFLHSSVAAANTPKQTAPVYPPSSDHVTQLSESEELNRLDTIRNLTNGEWISDSALDVCLSRFSVTTSDIFCMDSMLSILLRTLPMDELLSHLAPLNLPSYKVITCLYIHLIATQYAYCHNIVATQ